MQAGSTPGASIHTILDTKFGAFPLPLRSRTPSIQLAGLGSDVIGSAQNPAAKRILDSRPDRFLLLIGFVLVFSSRLSVVD